MTLSLSKLAVGLLSLLFLMGPTGSCAAADFYKGKTIRVLVGFTPGGGPDIRTRLVARHWPAHISGQPRMIVQNQPGAGGLLSTNLLFNVIKPDGLTLANIVRDNAIRQMSDQPGVKYDMAKFAWIGSLLSEGNVVFIRSALPYKDLSELKRAKAPIIFAARSVGSTNFIAGKGMEALGVPLNLVVGYGTAKLNLAFAQGEVEGSALGWGALSKGRADWVKPGGLARLIVEFGTRRTPGLNVPFGPNLEPEAGQKGVYDVINKALGMPQGSIAAPPGTPEERLAILRNSYKAMLQDPKFKADAAKLNINVDALVGDDLGRVFADFLGAPQSIKAEFKAMMR